MYTSRRGTHYDIRIVEGCGRHPCITQKNYDLLEISISLISIGLTMYFTLIFEDGKEGPARIYDLVYHPCPVWMKGEEIITVPDASNPKYQIGHLEALFSTGKGDDEDYYNEPAKIFDFGLTHSTVLVCVHPGGHGESKDLELLCEDLSNHDFVPKVVDFLQQE